MTDRELLQQVLDAWQDHWVNDHQSALLEMIRANCANCARCGEKNPADIHTCTPMHWSDCAVHREPAYPAGECDCGLVPVAWADKHDIEREGHDFYVNRQQPAKDGVPLYTAPPQKKKQEPVAWMNEGDIGKTDWKVWAYGKPTATIPLYTAPPQRKWQGLTDEEIKEILDCGRPNLVNIKKAEQKLKEKNT